MSLVADALTAALNDLKAKAGGTFGISKTEERLDASLPMMCSSACNIIRLVQSFVNRTQCRSADQEHWPSETYHQFITVPTICTACRNAVSPHLLPFSLSILECACPEDLEEALFARCCSAISQALLETSTAQKAIAGKGQNGAGGKKSMEGTLHEEQEHERDAAFPDETSDEGDSKDKHNKNPGVPERIIDVDMELNIVQGGASNEAWEMGQGGPLWL